MPDKPAKVEAFLTKAVLDALNDPAVVDLPPGPLQDFITELNIRVTEDYDPGDVIVLVVHPPQHTGLKAR